MTEYIYYTGIGAKKNGRHSVKEFLKIMNKHFNVNACSDFLPELDYKPCHDYKEIKHKAMEYNMKHNKTSKKLEKQFKKLLNKCNKYKKTAKKRICNLDEYIEYSGAERKI